MGFVIAEDDPRSEDVQSLLQRHLAFAHEVTPPGHVHALDIDALLDPSVTCFSARRDGLLLGVAALKRLDASHAELKSMHVGETTREEGIGTAMVEHLLAVAAVRNYARVSLETGTMEAFAPARALYTKIGFRPCEPFAPYTANPDSTCMSIEIGSTLRTP